MKYGEYPVYDALGVELTHPVKCRDTTLKKGHVLTSQDIGRLKYAGIKTVVGARFSSNDVHPETAADILLKTMVGDYLRYTLPDESGYCEIFADIDGVFVFDPDRLKRLNTHCEDFAVMTVRPYLPVYKGQFVANLRLFSPAVDADVLNQAVTKISGTGALFKIAPYAFCKIGYIRTVATGTTPEQIDDDALEKRFAAYGFSIVHSTMCAHDSESVEKAVRDALDARAEIVLVESPFPPLNRDDTVPKAFKEAAACLTGSGAFPMATPVPAKRNKSTSLKLSPNATTSLFPTPYSRHKAAAADDFDASPAMISRYRACDLKIVQFGNGFFKSFSSASIVSGSPAHRILCTGALGSNTCSGCPTNGRFAVVSFSRYSAAVPSSTSVIQSSFEKV